jgi:hypothetical protein
MPDVRQLLVAQLCDLVAVTLGATRDAAAAAEGRGLRAARLRAIKTDIEANLVRLDLLSGLGLETCRTSTERSSVSTVRHRRKFEVADALRIG